MKRRIALSSIASTPLSDETRQRLIDAGVPETEMVRTTELWGQSVLALKAVNDGEDPDAPDCHRRSFNPKADLCSGCAWMTTCWWSDREYLSRIPSAGYPPGVPRHVVKSRLDQIKSRPMPARRKAPKRRLPPRRKKK